MTANRKPNECAELARARRRFDHWRRSRRSRRARIPESLWKIAVTAAAICGISRTSTTLRVNYSALKKRVSAAGKRPGQATAPLDAFLELAPLASAGAGQCVVQLEDPEGAKMRIELTGIQTSDLVALSRSLWPTER